METKLINLDFNSTKFLEMFFGKSSGGKGNKSYYS